MHTSAIGMSLTLSCFAASPEQLIHANAVSGVTLHSSKLPGVSAASAGVQEEAAGRAD